MTDVLHNVFADTSFWIALIVKQDQYHERAQQWSSHIDGRITTTSAVMLETANALSRPGWRAPGVALVNHIYQRDDIEVVSLTPALWDRGWKLYCDRMDKAWSLTDCISFLAMQDVGLVEALTADEHFQQAGFRALLLEEP